MSGDVSDFLILIRQQLPGTLQTDLIGQGGEGQPGFRERTSRLGTTLESWFAGGEGFRAFRKPRASLLLVKLAELCPGLG